MSRHAPKRKKNLRHRGSVVPAGNGFRTEACIDGRPLKGPTHGTEAEAKCDLRQAQSASSETEYSSVLQRFAKDGQTSNVVMNGHRQTLQEACQGEVLCELIA